jgi:hypothetical protein
MMPPIVGHESNVEHGSFTHLKIATSPPIDPLNQSLLGHISISYSPLPLTAPEKPRQIKNCSKSHSLQSWVGYRLGETIHLP